MKTNLCCAIALLALGGCGVRSEVVINPPAVTPAQPPPVMSAPGAPTQNSTPLAEALGVAGGLLDGSPVAPVQNDAAGNPGQETNPPAANGQDVEQVKAQVGVGIKGRSLDEHEGLIVTPVKVYFSAQERIAFDIAIPGAMNLYNAANGHDPKSHEEFMEQIIAFNKIKLPQLPPGQSYLYDPEKKELMVQRPKPAAPQPATP